MQQDTAHKLEYVNCIGGRILYGLANWMTLHAHMASLQLSSPQSFSEDRSMLSWPGSWIVTDFISECITLRDEAGV